MIQDTSIAAYKSIQLGDLNHRQYQVFYAIRNLRRASNESIAKYTGFPINCICPRVLELREAGLVVDAGIGIGSSGRAVHFWREADYIKNL